MYHVEITPEADSGFKVRSSNYEFSIGIKGKGITPPDTLLAGLGSCIGVYLRRYLEGANITLKDFSITVEAEFSTVQESIKLSCSTAKIASKNLSRSDFLEEPPVCFRNIDVRIDLKGLKLEQRRKQALLEFIGNCPVHNTLKASPNVEVTII